MAASVQIRDRESQGRSWGSGGEAASGRHILVAIRPPWAFVGFTKNDRQRTGSVGTTIEFAQNGVEAGHLRG
jgi:hypothetical protein